MPVREKSEIDVVDRDLREIVGHVDSGLLILFVLLEEALDLIDHVGNHFENLFQIVAAADRNQAHVALIYREEGDRLDGDARAAAAAEEIFFLVL